jgi:hypothetical protein
MELAVLTGSGAAPLVQLAGPAPMTPMVPVERVMLLGHRSEDLDDASAAELAGLPPVLRRIDASTLVADPANAGERAARWLEHVDPVREGAWLHLDLDVLDPDVLPAVTYPQFGGPGWGAARAGAHATHPLADPARRQRGRLPSRPRSHRRPSSPRRGATRSRSALIRPLSSWPDLCRSRNPDGAGRCSCATRTRVSRRGPLCRTPASRPSMSVARACRGRELTRRLIAACSVALNCAVNR